MLTIRYRTLVAFFAGVTLTIVAGFAFQAWRADAYPGEFDTTYVPVTPCRLIDTRPGDGHVGPHGPFGTNDVKTVDGTGAGTACADDLVDAWLLDGGALALNVTAVGATLPTFLTIWPGGPRPEVSSLNPFPGQPPTPNAVTVPLTSDGSFRIYNLQGNVDVIIDMVGLYMKRGLENIGARLSELEKAQPFVLSESTEGDVELTNVSETILSVQLTAPVSGQVSIVAAANVDQSGVLGADVDCDINTATSGKGMELWFERDAVSNSGNVAGTRVFDLAEDATETYRLQCRESVEGGILDQATLTAIFTPAP
jgi:hypothetical protein